MPQECGAKMNTSYMTLTDESGEGVGFFGSIPYTMSASPHLPEELDGMMHTCDTLSREKVIFTIDYAQNGLGNRSCGPDVLPQYRLMPHEARYAYTLCHVTAENGIKVTSYDEDILPPVKAFSTSMNSGIPKEEYRDPSDEDVRKKTGFKV